MHLGSGAGGSADDLDVFRVGPLLALGDVELDYARIRGRGILVPPEDPRAAAWPLSRVLGGERPDPVQAGHTPGSSPPAQLPRCTPGPIASCSPAVPHPGSQPGRGLETSASWP
jgi:hypothetical protein